MTVGLEAFTAPAFAEVPKRVDINSNEIRAFLDRKLEDILRHPGVDHPFLNNYARTGLPREAERLLYLETTYYFRHVPFYICTICTLTRDENILREVIRNVADEMGETKSHAQIYAEFLHELGITPKDVEMYRPLASTTALNEGIRRLYAHPTSIVKAMGALYAEECQSASMVSKYNDGLKKSGRGQAARAFWELHIRAEIGHSNSVFNCVHPYLASAENRAVFSEGISDYMALLAAYWDGIAVLLGGPRR